MFSGCTSLTLDALHFNWSDLTSIGDNAFNGCSSLTGSVTLNKDCIVSSSALGTGNSKCPLTVNIGY